VTEEYISILFLTPPPERSYKETSSSASRILRCSYRRCISLFLPLPLFLSLALAVSLLLPLFLPPSLSSRERAIGRRNMHRHTSSRSRQDRASVRDVACTGGRERTRKRRKEEEEKERKRRKMKEERKRARRNSGHTGSPAILQFARR